MKLFILLCVVTGGAYAKNVCGEKQRYLECGTACEPTCANPANNNGPRACPAVCVSGCFCEEGYVKTEDGKCIPPYQCPEEEPEAPCRQPVKPGMCLAYFERFYFDQTSGECKKFVYGGCQGNKNNFKTIEECQKTCGVQQQQQQSSPDCLLYPDSGVCDAYMPRYYFDKFTGSCKTFVYGGCGGNGNNFPTEEACNARCLV